MKDTKERFLLSKEISNLIPNFLSTRSVLYNLEPIGIGTPYVESLTSYISRLAYTHNVTVSSLIKGTVVPLLEVKYLKKALQNGTFETSSRYLNGNSKVSQYYVNALELLTCRNDLHYLTMNNWTGIFLQNTVGKYRKWCSVCLDQMMSESKEIYEPLIWYLSDIKKCDIHETRLQDECPKCKKKLQFLYSDFMAGFCPFCSSFLGDFKSINESLSSNERIIQRNYQQLLENAPKLDSFPTKNSISIVLNKIKEKLGIDSVRKFALLFDVKYDCLSGWMNNRNMPSLESLFEIVDKLNLTIYEFFYEHNTRINLVESKNIELSKKQKILSRKEIENCLQEALNLEEMPISLYAFAKEKGFNYQRAQRHFPELCKLIRENHSRYKKELIRKKQTQIEDKLRLALQRDVPISLLEFSKENSIPVITARRYAPELCKSLVQRYNNYIRERRKKKEEEICIEIKEIVIELHQKGLFPSIRLIQKVISDPRVFMDPNIRDKWREIIESLDIK